nr:hypothetical protein [Tanacetum cinerariifolium]
DPLNLWRSLERAETMITYRTICVIEDLEEPDDEADADAVDLPEDLPRYFLLEATLGRTPDEAGTPTVLGEWRGDQHRHHAPGPPAGRPDTTGRFLQALANLLAHQPPPPGAPRRRRTLRRCCRPVPALPQQRAPLPDQPRAGPAIFDRGSAARCRGVARLPRVDSQKQSREDSQSTGQGVEAKLLVQLIGSEAWPMRPGFLLRTNAGGLCCAQPRGKYSFENGLARKNTYY